MKDYKIRDISWQTKGTLELLIREIQDALKSAGYIDEGKSVNDVLDVWIKANDLHPEKVVVRSMTDNTFPSTTTN